MENPLLYRLVGMILAHVVLESKESGEGDFPDECEACAWGRLATWLEAAQ